jgi:adenylate cyclase
MMVNPRLQVVVVEPTSGRSFRLNLLYERTETEGPLFERVKTSLDAVASHEGMAKVFLLAAVDVCRVLSCDKVPSDWDTAPVRREHARLDDLDLFSLRIVDCGDVESLIATGLAAGTELLGWQHASIHLLDETGTRLLTVGSHGYETSGIGAEVALGEGVIGVAAQRRQAVRIGNLLSEIAYAQAVRASAQPEDLSSEIPLPGLPNALSQIAVPILWRELLLGAISLQSDEAGRYTAQDEAALNVAARQFGLALMLLRYNRDREPMITAQVKAPIADTEAAQIKYYAADDSVFIDNEYIIKGVGGRVLWRLLRSYADERRVEFTNKEIRLDPHLDLPDIKDNLEARLILLRKRLTERCDLLQIQNTGRGRFELVVARPFELREA